MGNISHLFKLHYNRTTVLGSMSSLFLLYLLFYLCFSFFTFSYFLLLFTFFCCSRSSLYVCTFFSISFLNISQRDFEPNKKRAKAVLKNSLILFIVVCLVDVMIFLVKLFQFSHWMSTFCIPQPSNRRTKSTSGRSFSPSRSTSFAYSFLFHFMLDLSS